MERAAIEELYVYTGWAWERIARVVDELPPETFAREVAGSGWPTLAACFEHRGPHTTDGSTIRNGDSASGSFVTPGMRR